jgi:peroxiredoxin
MAFAALLVAVVASAAGGPSPPAAVSFAGVAIRAVDGSRVDLGERLAAGPVLLDFWATWCRPCERSLPSTQRLHERFRGQGLTVLGVSVDGPRNWARVRPFASRLGLGFPIVIDEDGSLQRRFHVGAVPTTVLIARSGRVARVHAGWLPGEDDSLAAAVAVLLAARDSTPAP